MFFTVSKIFWLFADPINFILILGAVGLFLSLGFARRLGAALAATSIVLIVIAGFSPLGSLLLRPLEDRFPRPPSDIAAPAGIIVLGGALDSGLTKARGVPTLLAPAARLTEAVVLARRYPKARLIFTSGAANISGKGVPEAPAVRDLWISLGVPAEQITIEDRSRNTWENGLFTRALIHPKPDETFLLVTSAWHMPRSMGIFRKLGFKVVAYPVDYQTSDTSEDFQLPHLALDEMTRLENAMHEWIGLVAYRLRNKTDAWFPAP
jgi:uncharacterized SAM-binding protein YcdF (DUF218 family)